MSVKLCVVMDPLHTIKVKKDTSFALLLSAQARGWEIHYLNAQDIWLEQAQVYGRTQQLEVKNQEKDFYRWHDPLPKKTLLTDFDVIFIRKDPPFDERYLYTTYLLELAQKAGCVVVNDPKAIRGANEKLFALWFSQCCPPTQVTSQLDLIHEFLDLHQHIVVKPLNSMGGQGIFMLKHGDLNVNTILDTLTKHGTNLIVAQRYIPEITQGDKRILMIDGEPYPYALARIPAPTDFRGNLAAGGHGVGVQLTPSDLRICQQVGPTLKEQGLFFVGLDVIGEYLTEINVTSPTCVREIEAAFHVDICQVILSQLEQQL